MYVYDGERFLFGSRSNTRKVTNLRSHPRARVLVQGGSDPARWIAAGPTQITAEDASRALNRQVGEHYLTETGRLRWERARGPMEDVTIVLRPERWTWWDVEGMFNVIDDQGDTEEAVAGWFVPLDP